MFCGKLAIESFTISQKSQCKKISPKFLTDNTKFYSNCKKCKNSKIFQKFPGFDAAGKQIQLTFFLFWLSCVNGSSTSANLSVSISSPPSHMFLLLHMS